MTSKIIKNKKRTKELLNQIIEDAGVDSFATSYFTCENPSSDILKLCEELTQLGLVKVEDRSENEITDFAIPQKKILVNFSEIKSLSSVYQLFLEFKKDNTFDDLVFKDIFFVSDENKFYFRDFKSYETCMTLVPLLQSLKKLADHDDQSLVFWAKGKLDVPIEISKDFLDRKMPYHSKNVNSFFNDIFNETCEESGCGNKQLNKERIGIFKTVLKRMLDDVEDCKKLETIAVKFDLLESNWRQDYDAYIHNIDFDEIRQKVRERIESTHLSIGKILSDNQLKIIALPLAIAFIVSKLKESNTIEIQVLYWISILIMAMFSYITYKNQSDDLNALSTSFNSWTKWIKSYPIYDEYHSQIDGVNKRISFQKNIVFSTMAITIFFVIAAITYLFELVF